MGSVKVDGVPLNIEVGEEAKTNTDDDRIT